MQPPDTLPPSWQRLLALSGVVFAVLFVVAWFASGGNTPDYAATDQDWTTWADDNQWKSRIGGFLILLAGFVFLHFAGTIRSVLGSAESTVRGSVQLARVAYAGAITGITGITMAIVMIAAAATEGADADPVVSRAVTSCGGGAILRRRDGLCRDARGCWTAHTAHRSLRPLDRHRGTTRRTCPSSSRSSRSFRAPAKTASLATAFFLASWRSRSGRSLRASLHTARWRP